MELSKAYSYGCLFFAEKLFVYINKNHAYSGTNKNDMEHCDSSLFEKIQHIFHERIEYIYNNKDIPSSGLNLTITPTEKKNETKLTYFYTF